LDDDKFCLFEPVDRVADRVRGAAEVRRQYRLAGPALAAAIGQFAQQMRTPAGDVIAAVALQVGDEALELKSRPGI
jgi:hypothetical protein